MFKYEERNKKSIYYYEGTRVLINKLDIRDFDELANIEKNIVARKLAFLYLEPINGKFDKTHLLNIHKFLFESLYDFAGKIRDCDIAKNDLNGKPTIFCRPFAIEEQLNLLLNNMKKDLLIIKDRNDLIKKISHYYCELNYIHPFREGNGRTIREFIREYIEFLSINNIIENSIIEYSRMDKDLFLEGTIRAVMEDTTLLEKEFDKAIVKIDKDKNKKL